jgi:hypothetical protein
MDDLTVERPNGDGLKIRERVTKWLLDFRQLRKVLKAQAPKQPLGGNSPHATKTR